MAEVAGRAVEQKREMLLQAAQRWQARQNVREGGLAKIERQGIGSADTPKRQAEYAVRETIKAAAKPFRFVERQVGPTWDLVKVASVQAMQSAEPVARIVRLGTQGYEPEGIATGLLIGNDLLLTNHHVFGTRGEAAGHAANFHHVQDERGAKRGKFYELDPDRFFVSDERLDFSIVAVKPIGLEGDTLASIGSIRMIGATGKVLTGQPVNIVQHPFGGVRQFALTNNTLLDILDTGFLHYEGDTHRGSSGAPLFNKDWEMVGLHHCGVPLVENGNIKKKDGGNWDAHKDSDDDIQWIANEGTRVSFIVERLANMTVRDSEQPILNTLLATTTDIGAGMPLLERNDPKGFPMGTNVFNITGPVTIHQYAAGAVMASPADGATGAPAAARGNGTADTTAGTATADRLMIVEKALTFDPNYEARSGYDADFLGAGARVALPTLDARHDGQFYTVKDYKDFYEEYRDVPELDTSGLNDADAIELKYHHYSLVMHKGFKMCIWTASNCDYRDEMREDTRDRKLYGSESWRKDPRVPPWYQLLAADVYDPGRRIDKGHIVRREDSCWGATPEETELANSDTFHWTNCTPQHEAFNQENPRDNRKNSNIYAGLGVKGIWGQFEAELARRIDAAGGQAILFAGPVLKDFFSSASFTQSGAKVPRRFWKVVVCRESRKRNAPLLAHGFLFNQTRPVERFGLSYEESIDLGFEKNRETLVKIQEMTGVVFDPQVLAADQPFSPNG